GQVYRTHNNLLKFYNGADGIKTGFTNASGYNLVASAVRDDKRIIGVVFGGTTVKARDLRLAELMDEGFAYLQGQPEIVLAAAPRIEAFDGPVLADSTAVGDADEAPSVSSILGIRAAAATELPMLPADSR